MEESPADSSVVSTLNVSLKEQDVAKAALALPAGQWGQESTFCNGHGQTIFWRKSLPVGDAKGLCVLVHGIGEHSGRYGRVAKALVDEGYAVVALDHKGHGKSEGDQCYVWKFDEFVEDVVALTEMCSKEVGTGKTFLVGHSMGGLVSIRVCSARPDLFDGVVLSAPPLYVATGGKGTIGKALSKYFPKLPSDPLDISTLCNDPQVVADFHSDKLVFKGRPPLRILAEIVKNAPRTRRAAGSFKVPYLLLHGTGDKMCLIRGSKAWNKNTTVEDKTFKEYPGAFHELFNEPGGAPLHDAVEWIKARSS